MGAREKFMFNDIVMNKLHIQRKTGKYCDIRLSVGDKFIWGHSSIMCSISPFINDQCCDDKPAKVGGYREFSFNSPLTIKLFKKDVFECFECLQLLVDIIYGQSVQDDQLHSDHLYNLCKMLNISDILIKFICNRIKCEAKSITDDIKDDTVDEPIQDVNKNRKKMRIRSRFVMSDFKALTGKMHSCIGCHYKCYRPSDLLKHLRETSHGSDVCSLCLSKFDSADELKEHYNLHDHPKPFFCTVCDLRFQTRCLLSQHLPRHSKETPYTCSFCKKGFKWKHGLNSHLLIHSNEKKHLCDECGFSTMHAKTLRAHKLMHTGELFRCSFPGCKHTCARKENMKLHLFTHNNDKPFVCEICGLKFTLNKSLKRHTLIHTAVDLMNTCPHCPFKALRTDNLKAHILRQHADLKTDQDTSNTIVDQEMENDLCVLADAASLRTKIQEPTQHISSDSESSTANIDKISIKPNIML